MGLKYSYLQEVNTYVSYPKQTHRLTVHLCLPGHHALMLRTSIYWKLFNVAKGLKFFQSTFFCGVQALVTLAFNAFLRLSTTKKGLKKMVSVNILF